MIIQTKEALAALLYAVADAVMSGDFEKDTSLVYPFDFMSLSINEDKTVDIYRREEKKLDGYEYTEAK